MSDPKDRGMYILVRALMRRMGDEPVTIPKAEWTAAAMFGTGMKIEIEPDGDIRVWIEPGESS